MTPIEEKLARLLGRIEQLEEQAAAREAAMARVLRGVRMQIAWLEAEIRKLKRSSSEVML